MKVAYSSILLLVLATVDTSRLSASVDAFTFENRCSFCDSSRLFRVFRRTDSDKYRRTLRPKYAVNQDDSETDLVTQFINTTSNLFVLVNTTWTDFSQSLETTTVPSIRLRKRDLIQSILRKAAALSLKDYEWRSNYFRTTEAERRVEESLARLMGEEVTYIRPGDAPEQKIGPLGKAEKQLVEWLGLVIEEEGRRARLIQTSDGALIRPIDLQATGQGGPLSSLEYSVVSFLNQIRLSERERVISKTLRPKDLDEDKRGPLGQAELLAVSTLEDIRKSEMMRMDQSRARGDVVRPVDVPNSVLGEMERFYMEVATAERQRKKESEMNDGKIVRPMDSSLQGPLGIAENTLSKAVRVLRQEELDRLESIKRSLAENRPMQRNRDSLLGWTEAIFVGIIRAPAMVWMVLDRVMELMDSSRLDPEDEQILRQSRDNQDSSGTS